MTPNGPSLPNNTIYHPQTARQSGNVDDAPKSDGVFNITVFESQYKPKGRRRPVAFPHTFVGKTFTEPPTTGKPKKYLSCWSPATFKGDLRNKKNVEFVHLLVLDQDDNTSVDDVAAIWSGHAGTAHSTPSHTPDNPRSRAILQLSRPVTADEHRIVNAWARARAKMAKRPADEAAKDASRLYYLPHKRPEVEYRFLHFEGQPLDVEAVLSEWGQREETRRAAIAAEDAVLATEAGIANPEAFAHGVLQKARTALQLAEKGERHTTIFKQALWVGQYVDIGWLDGEEAKGAIIETITEAGWEVESHLQTIDDAFERGKQDPPKVAKGVAVREPTDPVAVAMGAHVEGASVPPVRPNEQLPPLKPDFVAECGWKADQGNAEMLVALLGDRLRYDPVEKAWYYWDGHHWRRDIYNIVRRLVACQLGYQYKMASATLEREANALEKDDPDKKAMLKSAQEMWTLARSIRSIGSVEKCLKMAEAYLGFDNRLWDSDPWLLGVANGVLVLNTGEFRPGRPEDNLRVHAPTAWAGIDAPAPRFERFLSEMLEDRLEIVGYLRRLSGYGITGLSTEHIYVMLYGAQGRNGKDTLLERFQRVLGEDLAGPVSKDVFVASKSDNEGHNGAAQPHLTALRGKRIVWASETSGSARFNEEQVKRITGGGTIVGRNLYENEQRFTPTHVAIIITNFKPKANPDDAAFWTRTHLIELKMRFVDEPKGKNERTRNPMLGQELDKEAPGILAWLVRGCLEWQQEGLKPPAIVVEGTEAYRDEQDSVGQFLRSEFVCLDPDDHAVRESAQRLYKAFAAWVIGILGQKHAISMKTFGEAAKRRLESAHTKNGNVYLGVRLLKSAEEIEGLATMLTVDGGADFLAATDPAADPPSPPNVSPGSIPGEGCEGCEGTAAGYSLVDSSCTQILADHPSHPSHPSPEGDPPDSSTGTNVPSGPEAATGTAGGEDGDDPRLVAAWDADEDLLDRVERWAERIAYPAIRYPSAGHLALDAGEDAWWDTLIGRARDALYGTAATDFEGQPFTAHLRRSLQAALVALHATTWAMGHPAIPVRREARQDEGGAWIIGRTVPEAYTQRNHHLSKLDKAARDADFPRLDLPNNTVIEAGWAAWDSFARSADLMTIRRAIRAATVLTQARREAEKERRRTVEMDTRRSITTWSETNVLTLAADAKTAPNLRAVLHLAGVACYPKVLDGDAVVIRAGLLGWRRWAKELTSAADPDAIEAGDLLLDRVWAMLQAAGEALEDDGAVVA